MVFIVSLTEKTNILLNNVSSFVVALLYAKSRLAKQYATTPINLDYLTVSNAVAILSRNVLPLEVNHG